MKKITKLTAETIVDKEIIDFIDEIAYPANKKTKNYK